MDRFCIEEDESSPPSSYHPTAMATSAHFILFGPYSEWSDPSGEFVIADDPSRLDVDVIHGFLSRSYWSTGVPRAIVEQGIERSVVFGVYARSGEQVAFARVVSDCASFAYLADVFVLEGFRGRGLSKWLMAVVDAHPRLQGLRRWMLATRDAHGLYAKSGFVTASAERCMERLDPDVYVRQRVSPGLSRDPGDAV